MNSTQIKEKVLSLPLKPGVYIMLDESGGVIYVGKAKLLKNRVSQYFQDSQNHSEKTRNMISQINDFDFIVADSELEALVLECSLIKRHMPKYNILLKDAKGYPFIRVDLKTQYPRFTLEARIKEDGAKYFGPFGRRYITRQVITAVTEALKLPDCGRVFPRDIGKGRPCLNFHIGRCAGVCAGSLSEAEYRYAVKQGIDLLDGKYEKVYTELKGEMEKSAEELNFERAATYRDRLAALETLGQKQKIISGVMSDVDAVGWYSDAKRAVAVLHYIDGVLLDKEFEIIGSSVEGSGSEILDAFITQYYAGRSSYPKSILLPFDIENRASLSQMLSAEAGFKVELTVPVRGDKVSLVKLASSNAREEAERITSHHDRGERTLSLLRDALRMDSLPQRIEAFDISTLSGTDTVASMTVFKNGYPFKKDYRRFKIEGVHGQDDYASMREAVSRRFKRYLDGDESFSELPELLLIDGGAEHTKAAEQVLESLGLSLTVYGMVKDGRHRTRALIDSSGREVGISHNPQLFGLIGRIQEETHRFAIEYNRSLRKKRIYASELDGIEGIGEIRKKALLRHFKSIKKIREAGVDELSAAIPGSAAKKVYNYFHGEISQTDFSAK